jgi:NTP pyrophosphatase (non-canonical NTP hydrolase)
MNLLNVKRFLSALIALYKSRTILEKPNSIVLRTKDKWHFVSLTSVQWNLKQWQERNFPKNSSDQMLKGMMEEFGELCHADLKQEQGIREGADGSNINALIGDAWADITIYGMQYLSSRGINAEQALLAAYTEVLKRDWVKFPINGRTK